MGKEKVEENWQKIDMLHNSNWNALITKKFRVYAAASTLREIRGFTRETTALKVSS